MKAFLFTSFSEFYGISHIVLHFSCYKTNSLFTDNQEEWHLFSFVFCVFFCFSMQFQDNLSTLFLSLRETVFFFNFLNLLRCYFLVGRYRGCWKYCFQKQS